MSDLPPCPACKSPYAWESGLLLMCPECGHEWDPNAVSEDAFVVKDSNGNILQDGDSVIVIKDLPV